MVGKRIRVATYVLMAFAVVWLPLHCTEDRRFEDSRLHIANEIDAILVAHGLCSDIPHCSAERIFNASPYSGGFSIQVWGHVGPNVLQEILDRCTAEFIRNPAIEAVVLYQYGVTKNQSLEMRFWERAPLVLSMKLNREV